MIDEAERAKPATLEGGRVDLRKIPLVTIDPPDARDHDDAVWAATGRRSGEQRRLQRAIVAIADVAYYVRPELRARPRSTPARQLVLLPRPRRADAARTTVGGSVLAEGKGQDRAIIACHMTFDAGRAN